MLPDYDAWLLSESSPAVSGEPSSYESCTDVGCPGCEMSCGDCGGSGIHLVEEFVCARCAERRITEYRIQEIENECY